MYTKDDFSITRTPASKLNEQIKENPGFGQYFSDHMLICDYQNGSWQKPEIKPYGPIALEPAAKIFHYGQNIFEGMKAFKGDQGKIQLFRPDQNFERFNRSCQRMCIPEFPREYFFGALDILMKLDQDWIINKEGYSLYIRPFVIATEGNVGASPSTSYRVMIITSPVKSYYSEDSEGMKILIQDKYSRSADGGIGFVKAGGNYGLSFFPTELAKEKGFEQIIWTDSDSHQYMEEAGTMNVFFRIDDTLITAPTNDRILDGITRKSLIQLAQDNDIKVAIRPVELQEIMAMQKEGRLKEIFGAGTAAIVVPCTGFGYKEDYFELPQESEPYGPKLKRMLQDIQYKRTEDKYNWLYEIN